MLSQNLSYTGNYNPFALIQNGAGKKSRKYTSRRSRRARSSRRNRRTRSNRKI